MTRICYGDILLQFSIHESICVTDISVALWMVGRHTKV